RETVILMSFIFTPFRRSHLWGFRINSLLVTLSLVAPYFLIFYGYILLSFAAPHWALRHAVIILLTSLPLAAIYYTAEKDTDFVWVIAYGFFWVLSCQWIIPYAFLTCRRQGAWLTRG
ncbi:MAG: hypothetical protein KGJ09_08125, partial [Candidatus Omnitrophica bacterium]|nr:hypothetical protein [Candidatus Omnitrophota bacterium]